MAVRAGALAAPDGSGVVAIGPPTLRPNTGQAMAYRVQTVEARGAPAPMSRAVPLPDLTDAGTNRGPEFRTAVTRIVP